MEAGNTMVPPQHLAQDEENIIELFKMLESPRLDGLLWDSTFSGYLAKVIEQLGLQFFKDGLRDSLKRFILSADKYFTLPIKYPSYISCVGFDKGSVRMGRGAEYRYYFAVHNPRDVIEAPPKNTYLIHRGNIKKAFDEMETNHGRHGIYKDALKFFIDATEHGQKKVRAGKREEEVAAAVAKGMDATEAKQFVESVDHTSAFNILLKEVNKIQDNGCIAKLIALASNSEHKAYGAFRFDDTDKRIGTLLFRRLHKAIVLDNDKLSLPAHHQYNQDVGGLQVLVNEAEGHIVPERVDESMEGPSIYDDMLTGYGASDELLPFERSPSDKDLGHIVPERVGMRRRPWGATEDGLTGYGAPDELLTPTDQKDLGGGGKQRIRRTRRKNTKNRNRKNTKRRNRKNTKRRNRKNTKRRNRKNTKNRNRKNTKRRKKEGSKRRTRKNTRRNTRSRR
jgi:hypothetical protein